MNLSASQLVGVLERLTLALRAPGQNIIGGEAQEFVGVLERLTLALKAPEQRANGDGGEPTWIYQLEVFNLEMRQDICHFCWVSKIMVAPLHS